MPAELARTRILRARFKGVRHTMIKLSLISMTLVFLSACGPAKIYRETYQAEPYDRFDNGKRRVYVGINATRKVKNKLPFYYSDIQNAPYELMVIAHSELPDKASITIKKAIIIYPDSTKHDLALGTNRVSCNLGTSKSNDRFNDCYVFLPFGEKLKYRDSYHFDVIVEFSFSDRKEINTLKVKMKSIKDKSNGTTFDVLMSV